MRLTRLGRVVGLALIVAAAFTIGAYGPLWDAMPWAVR